MSPRPNPGRTIAAEGAVADAVNAWLDDNERTIAWLARRMGEAGCPINTSSVWKFLRRERGLRVDEMLAMQRATGVDLVAMLEATRREA